MYRRGRTAELDGAFGYAIEILVVIGEPESAAVIIGSVLGGALHVLREMTVPADRTVPTVRELRAAVGGEERFRELTAQGAAMSYEELVAWSLSTLDELQRRLQP